MIKTKNLVPSIYYNKSRDFQAIGRVFEVLYNYAKTNADLILNSYEDVKMLDLLVKTLGFNSKHNYNTDDLVTLCNIFIAILKDKGSLTSVNEAVTALLNAQHVEKNFLVVDSIDYTTNKKAHSVDIYVPKELTDLILLEDLFDYILPAGYTYRFIYATFPGGDDSITTKTSVDSITNVIKYEDSNAISQVAVVKAVNDGHDVNITRPTATVSPTELGISYASVVFRPTVAPFSNSQGE